MASAVNATDANFLGRLSLSMVNPHFPFWTGPPDGRFGRVFRITPVTPDLGSVRQAFDAIVKDGHRAADVLQRIRQLAKKTDRQKARLDVNDVIRDVVLLNGGEVRSHEVSLRIDLAPALPPVLADRIQPITWSWRCVRCRNRLETGRRCLADE